MYKFLYYLCFMKQTNNQMTNTMELTKKIYISPMRMTNKMVYGNDGCICCMRPITKDDSYYVHLNIFMEALNPNCVTEENCEELTGTVSLGCFQIGNDCAKKMEGFVFKY